jgi:dTDP-4-amino-4,6-dideoxygalactose transaminase
MISILIPNLPKTEKILNSLKQIDKNKWYSNFGPLVKKFEKKLINKNFSHSKVNLTTVSSGTSALELTLLALGIPAGKRVLLPAFTFPATATAVIRNNLIPVLADIDSNSWLLTANIARKVLKTIKFDVVMPVATFGNPQNVEEWDKFTQETGIPVVIDAAAALGYQKIGKYSTVTFSLHATKPFGIGEGGLVVSKSKKLIEKIRKLSNFGFYNGTITECGINAKLSEYHAAVGLAQIKRQSKILKYRQNIWNYYKKYTNKMQLQKVPDNFTPAILAIKTDKNSYKLAKYLKTKNIETRHWYYPLDKHVAFANFLKTDLTNTENLATYMLGLPFHTMLKKQDIKYIMKCVNNFKQP